MKSNRDEIRQKIKDEVMGTGATDYIMGLVDNAVFACLMDSEYREEYTVSALEAVNETATTT